MLFLNKYFEIYDKKEPLEYNIEKEGPLKVFSNEQIQAHKAHHQKYRKLTEELIEELKNDYKWEKKIEKKINLDSFILKQLLRKYSERDFSTTQYWYHSLFWQNISNDFESSTFNIQKFFKGNNLKIEQIRENFIEKSLDHKTSGWYILGVNLKTNKIEQICVKDATNILKMNIIPLIIIDLWEHCFYLDYQSDKKKYLENIWSYLDWKIIEERVQNIEIIKKQFKT